MPELDRPCDFSSVSKKNRTHLLFIVSGERDSEEYKHLLFIVSGVRDSEEYDTDYMTLSLELKRSF